MNEITMNIGKRNFIIFSAALHFFNDKLMEAHDDLVNDEEIEPKMYKVLEDLSVFFDMNDGKTGEKTDAHICPQFIAYIGCELAKLGMDMNDTAYRRVFEEESEGTTLETTYLNLVTEGDDK